jgi:hypothetical protein
LPIPVLGKLFPVITISSKILFVPVNAAQLVPPTGIFETVGGGFPVFFPESCHPKLNHDPDWATGAGGRMKHFGVAFAVAASKKVIRNVVETVKPHTRR